MSSIAIRGHEQHWRDGVERIWCGVRAIGWRHIGSAAVVGLVFFAINLPVLIESVQKYGWHTGTMVSSALTPMIAAQLLMIGWVAANAAGDGPGRTTRLAWGLAASSLLACVLIMTLWQTTGALEFNQHIAAQRGKGPMPMSLMFVTELLTTLSFGLLAFTALEVLHRRSATQREFQEIARRQAAIAQQVLESRLAAMQAQVEPRFLFDSLVDIEALYARDATAAASLLDRLISYLRAALPKLREHGSTIDAEIELLQAYLQVVTALHGGRPRLTVTLGDDCRNARFYPMLLLPLVQRAVRHPDGPPESIRVGVSRAGDQIALVMRIAVANGCVEDPELARVRERLTGLYGNLASLDCVEIGAQTTQLTLRIPANSQTAAK